MIKVSLTLKQTETLLKGLKAIAKDNPPEIEETYSKLARSFFDIKDKEKFKRKLQRKHARVNSKYYSSKKRK